jgi:hypothetical protein
MRKYIMKCFLGSTKIFIRGKMTIEINTPSPVLIFYQFEYLPDGYKIIHAIHLNLFIILSTDRPNQAGVFCTVLVFFIPQYMQPEKSAPTIPKDSTGPIFDQ